MKMLIPIIKIYTKDDNENTIELNFRDIILNAIEILNLSIKDSNQMYYEIVSSKEFFSKNSDEYYEEININSFVFAMIKNEFNKNNNIAYENINDYIQYSKSVIYNSSYNNIDRKIESLYSDIYSINVDIKDKKYKYEFLFDEIVIIDYNEFTYSNVKILNSNVITNIYIIANNLLQSLENHYLMENILYFYSEFKSPYVKYSPYDNKHNLIKRKFKTSINKFIKNNTNLNCKDIHLKN